MPPPPESLKILTAPREGVSPEDVIRRGWPLGHTPKYIAAHRDVLEAAIPRLLKHPTPPFAFQRQLEATYTLQTYDRLPQIKAPTLVVTGVEDVLIPAKNSEILACADTRRETAHHPRRRSRLHGRADRVPGSIFAVRQVASDSGVGKSRGACTRRRGQS